LNPAEARRRREKRKYKRVKIKMFYPAKAQRRREKNILGNTKDTKDAKKELNINYIQQREKKIKLGKYFL